MHGQLRPVALGAVLVAAACAGRADASTVSRPPVRAAVHPHLRSAVPAGIQHVVIIIQENRSLDNLFNGFPGADTVTSGKTSIGVTVPLRPTSLAVPYDLGHLAANFLTDYDNGNMDGFDKETTRAKGSPVIPPFPAYQYVQSSDIGPYLSLATQYVLADEMFASQLSSSFASHEYLIAGQAGGTVNNPAFVPWGCDSPASNRVATLTAQRTLGPSIYPCLNYQTLADELDAKAISWRYYAPKMSRLLGGYQWSAFDAVAHIRNGPDWSRDVISPQTRILSDVQNGSLAAVTWVTPDNADSDHAQLSSNTGPAWVASIVDAIGKSPFWSSTAIFVVWDDWGGWYDHVPPPQLDYDGLGFRVPLIVVSPFAKTGYVSHVQYEFGSIVKFVESTFGLAALAASDARANPLDDCFVGGAKPRRYVPLLKPGEAARILHAPSGIPPDDE